MEPEKYSYPRFRSYQRDFVVKDILPGVDYNGSFMMNGAKFITASSKHPAQLVFMRDGKRQLAISSMKFTLASDRLTAENAAVAFYVGDDDSIANTGVTVRYNANDKKVVMINDPKRNFYSPYTDSYHELDIYCDQMTWNTTNGQLDFSTITDGNSNGSTTFESTNYYTYRKYREIQGIEDINPVNRVYDYSAQSGLSFSVKGFANYINMDQSQALLMIHLLCKHGLVLYNELTGRVTVKEKLEDYVRASSRVKGMDYDAISLESMSKGSNAKMDIDNFELTMNGVRQFVVSDSQQVVVYPRGGRISVGKNRSIKFAGRIDVGKFRMFVSEASFSYENYDFNLPHVDSMFFYVPDFDHPDTIQLVYTPLYNLVGRLQIDRPDNHCGLMKNKEYPIFNSLENSYVYFDKPEIQQRRYVRDRFYYTLHPFTINSMVNFVTDSLKFNGALTSAGIFPEIVMPLSVQRDYYLGFNTDTPPNGLPAYGGKGTYTQALSLDHNGLKGRGKLDYLSSHSRGRDYLFLPDSMIAMPDTFYVVEEGSFPDIKNGRVSQHWLPYADSMSVASLKQGRPFSMYHGESTLRGRVMIQPHGAGGAGTAIVREGELQSNHFELLAREMNADVTNFTLHSTVFDAVAFSAREVRSHVDYDEMRAEFTSHNGPAISHLPMVKYDALADVFVWQILQKELQLANSQRGTAEGLDGMDMRQRLQKRDDMPGVKFTSTDVAQKGLSYNALQASYRYNSVTLSANGVYLLCVADAAIAPQADSLCVMKGGKMRALDNATLLFNRAKGYHLVSEAKLSIVASDSYKGTGYINYVDNERKMQRIFLSDIAVDNRGVTIGQGVVADSASFMLNKAFGFAGKVRAEGDKEFLFFDGGVRLVQKCIPTEQLGLLAYADYTDPEHVHINVPEIPADWKGHPITVSVLMDKSTLKPHAAFLTKERPADNALLSAHGVLTYNTTRDEYMVASQEKVDNPDAVVAPYLSMKTNACMVEGEGPLSFAMRRTQATIYAYGSVSIDMYGSEPDRIHSVFGLSFPIAKEVKETLLQNLKDDLRLPPARPKTNPEMRHALMQYMGKDAGSATYALYSASGKLDKMPQEMQHTLLLDNIQWQYSPLMGYYYGGKAVLVAIDDKAVSLEMKVKLQIVNRSNSQHVVCYIQGATDHWYYFKYDVGSQELTIYSSSQQFTDKIKSIPIDQRKIEKQGLGTFRYFVGNNSSEVRNWIDLFSHTVYSDGD